ncbi:hypothetical protein [Labilibaculum antarcticum]|uniref:Uncharacterized protein n=1 Tax=Labilibaculum antarcticum TaxID=1717717 RepID=A0A1Y1CPL3_9BACT|nr:hypothetical protein [Labilibaculum antarcticum]BAX82210.1 hypothetical protein ALGA_3918 [Labilibaculum antarcticum]
MASLVLPTSDLNRLKMLDRSIATAQKDAVLGTSFIPPKLLREAEELKLKFRTVYDLSNSSLSVRQKEVREKNETFVKLEVVVRDFFDGLRRRTYRMDHPAEVLRYYNITAGGELPTFSKDMDLVTAAENILLGEQKAVEAGYPAMSNPSAEEVALALESAKKEFDEIAPADRAVNKVQKDLAEVREPVDEMIKEIAAYIQFSMRNETTSNVRRFMRTYGFEYRYLQGEPVDEELVVNETPKI